MSEMSATQFSCDGCGRKYAWKERLAGKRVKCKCTHVMTVPQAPPEPEIDENALYELAAAEEAAAANAPSQHRIVERPVVKESSRANSGAMSGASGGASARAIPSSAAGLAIGYQRGPTQRERDRFSTGALMDMNRDVYVPTVLLIGGLLIYVMYYALNYKMSGAGIAAVTLGLGVMTAFKALLLVGFALIVAGPLGVSFGGIWTAIVKLAAIAVFSDSVTTWVDAGVSKMAGGAGGFGGIMSFPVSLAIYWGLLIYLFSMDPGDSWLVVIILAVFDFIVRWALLLILLKVVLSWGGVSSSAINIPTFGGGGSAPIQTAIETEVADLKERKLLVDAHEMIASGRQEITRGSVDAWYAAGCKHVWFAISRDFSGHTTPGHLVIEMPKDKASRAKVYTILKAYYDGAEIGYDPSDLVDDGEKFITAQIRSSAP